MTDTLDWLEAGDSVIVSAGAKLPGERRRAAIMQAGAMLGKDRVWFTDGEYIWFRRNVANPATLERHNRFNANGDYTHVETQDDVEIYELKPQSVFAAKKSDGSKILDLGELDFYNVRRQAAMACCRREWQTFLDIMTYLRDGFRKQHGANVGMGEAAYADCYASVMASVAQRLGPSPQEVNNELLALAARQGQQQKRIITLGR